MSRPFVALVSDTAVFDPVVHARYDIYPQSIYIRQDESQRAEVEIEILRPDATTWNLSNKRILVSEFGQLLFDGIIDPVPQGLAGRAVTITAIAKPPGTDAADEQLAAFAETLKTGEQWDPLFVPKGSEDNWAEILGAREEVLTYSRVQGALSLSPRAGGATNMEIRPYVGSVEYSQGAGVARKYTLKIEAKWKQSITQNFDDRGVLNDLVTYTPDGIVADFPKAGAGIGDGFTVIESRASIVQRFKKDQVDRTTEVESPVSPTEELDPAFIEEGVQKYKFDAMKMDALLRVQYRAEVQRTETVTLSIEPELQDSFFEKEEEIEETSLRDLTTQDDAKKWQQDENYKKDDEVYDAGYIYRARIDHFSGKTRAPGNWILVGESDYLKSRSIVSFFRSERGKAALKYGLRRLCATAAAAARDVRATFDTKMPRPWMVTPNMTVSMESDRLPGGYARGRLISYELSWARGRRGFSGTIACTPGKATAALERPTVGEATGKIPNAWGQCIVTVENDADVQEAKLLEQTGKEAVDLPETIIRITTTPASSSSFEQEVSVPISGKMTFAKQVSL